LTQLNQQFDTASTTATRQGGKHGQGRRQVKVEICRPHDRTCQAAGQAARRSRRASKAPRRFRQEAPALHPYARYRDLGIAAASGGLCQAHVIRLIGPCTDEVRKRHYHDTELQLIYVLKGWMKNEFEGHGEQLMEAGSCWLQPPNIKHTVLDYSDDCEVLEIIVPADFKTVELTK
jgi:uncharacterized RmlC-like cupin family protein